MTIAVMMSVYNGEAYLPQQLESLARQTVADSMTVYIRDDGSSDATAAIIAQWRTKLSLVLIPGENIGPAQSFWKLLTSPDIQAEYYAFCDQDDVWDPDKLENGIQKLKDDVHLSVCNCRLINGEEIVIQERMYEKPPQINIMRQFVCGVAQGCSMVFTDTLRRYFSEHEISCIPMHDTVVILHALGLGGVVWDENPRFSYRLHEKNVVAKGNKSPLKKLRTTWRNWKNGSRHSMAEVAAELLDKPLVLTVEERQFLAHVTRYRTSLRSRIYILRNAYTESVPRRAVRSYYLRVLLNLY